MFKKLLLMSFFFASIFLEQVNSASNFKGLNHIESTSPGIYSFDWRVQDEASGNDYGHRENKALDDVTHGEYYVRLPDGRLQTVTYYVDPQSGFRATVAYDREVAAPSNLPPLQITGAPAVIQGSGQAAGAISNLAPVRVTTTPARLIGIRVPSPPVRPVLAESFRKDKSLNHNSNAINQNINTNVNNIINNSKNNNVFLRPPVQQGVLVPITSHTVTSQNLEPEEQQGHPKDRFLSNQHRLKNLFQDDRKSKAEFNVHNKEAFTKTESELAGQDFSEPVFYPYKPKIVKHEDSILDKHT